MRWALQRSLAAAVEQGAARTRPAARAPARGHDWAAHEETELHLPAGAEVEVVETDRGGKSTSTGPGSSSATRSSI